MYNQNVKVKKEKMKRTIKIIKQRKKASKQLNLQKQSKQTNKKKTCELKQLRKETSK